MNIGDIYETSGWAIETAHGTLRLGLLVLMTTHKSIIFQAIGYLKYPNHSDDETQFPDKSLGFSSILAMPRAEVEALDLFCIYKEKENE